MRFPSISKARPLAPKIPSPKFGAYPVFPLGTINSEVPFNSFHLKILLLITSLK